MPTERDLEIARLQSSGWKLRDSDKELFSAIRSDQNARRAFQKLSTGKRPIPRVILLLNLGIDFDPFVSLGSAKARLKALNLEGEFGPLESKRLRALDYPSRWIGWVAWTYKWEGLEGAAKTLRAVEAKMRKHLGKSSLGPAPFPTRGFEKWVNDFGSINPDRHLGEICNTLAACAEELEKYCQMHRNWLKELPRKNAAQRERMVLFMRFVHERTGKWYFDDVAALLNVGRRINGRKELSADTLRKLRKLHTPRLDSLAARTGKS